MEIEILQLLEGARRAKGLTVIIDVFRAFTTESMIMSQSPAKLLAVGDIQTALLETSIHYEEGAAKYAERNWEKGIDLYCYLDSGVRHCLKYYRGDKDERHDRAFCWNMLGALWTIKNKPECITMEAKHDKSFKSSIT